MAVSVPVCEAFSVKKWCDLENRVKVCSRSLEITPFDRLHTSSYSPSIVTMTRFDRPCMTYLWLVARLRRCLTLSNPVPWQNWMAAYLGYTLRMKTLFCGWPVMVNVTHTRRRRTIFKAVALRHLGFWKFAVSVTCPLSACRSASWCNISLKSDNQLMSYGQKAILKMVAVAVSNFKNLKLCSPDCNRVQYLI